jgi:hypothetical protein
LIDSRSTPEAGYVHPIAIALALAEPGEQEEAVLLSDASFS